LWQVGDSSQQNGEFKRFLRVLVEAFIARKLAAGLLISIHKSNIIPLVHEAWNASFGLVKSNSKAIAARGWNPLN